MSNKVHWTLRLKRFFRRLRFAFDDVDAATWEYESCERCGHCIRFTWWVRDEVWVRVYGSPSGCFCPNCFLAVAARNGIKVDADDIITMHPTITYIEPL